MPLVKKYHEIATAKASQNCFSPVWDCSKAVLPSAVRVIRTVECSVVWVVRTSLGFHCTSHKWCYQDPQQCPVSLSNTGNAIIFISQKNCSDRSCNFWCINSCALILTGSLGQDTRKVLVSIYDCSSKCIERKWWLNLKSQVVLALFPSLPLELRVRFQALSLGYVLRERRHQLCFLSYCWTYWW